MQYYRRTKKQRKKCPPFYLHPQTVGISGSQANMLKERSTLCAGCLALETTDEKSLRDDISGARKKR